ncbi:MAG: SDR family oxidoreductase [Magnetococcales bacterium]|nr:SDR family oxidoreductase [Magnetococcales bacterium]
MDQTFSGDESRGMERFNLHNKTVVITGGGGLLGLQHGMAMAEVGANVVLWDINKARLEQVAEEIKAEYASEVVTATVDITDDGAIQAAVTDLISRFGRISVLVNNAANDPKMTAEGGVNLSRLENFPIEVWQQDITVGLTGAFLCARAIGTHMAEAGGGVIINIASDLGLIAPDQRLYRKAGLPEDQQPVKPVTYSVVKSGLIGMTRYLATYWADKGVRCNALAPGGIRTDQPEEFIDKLAGLIPMGRMAEREEYRGAVQFLASEASSYMNGSVLSMDGGRTCW